ncbi:tail assembly protein [Sphaerotilus sp.]|uniref:tail assembly protein n=1 Tax=Sphaerotilus sp. TaxID=2093942 RepID=UPI00286DDCC2|nr:tail assembly protein [Sphaerotilus sp.]
MTQILREVRLYGRLGKTFGRVHHLAVESAAEAVRALCAVLDGFERHLLLHSTPGYKVWAGRANLAETELAQPVGTAEVIRIVPVVEGAKRQGLGQTIVGAVLVIGGLVYAGMTQDGATAVKAVDIGLMMMLGGVIQMLSPQRGADGTEKDKNSASYSFNGAANVDAEGGCVPVLYGEMIVGSVVISGGIRTADIAV